MLWHKLWQIYLRSTWSIFRWSAYQHNCPQCIIALLPIQSFESKQKRAQMGSWCSAHHQHTFLDCIIGNWESKAEGSADGVLAPPSLTDICGADHGLDACGRRPSSFPCCSQLSYSPKIHATCHNWLEISPEAFCNMGRGLGFVVFASELAAGDALRRPRPAKDNTLVPPKENW